MQMMPYRKNPLPKDPIRNRMSFALSLKVSHRYGSFSRPYPYGARFGDCFKPNLGNTDQLRFTTGPRILLLFPFYVICFHFRHHET